MIKQFQEEELRRFRERLAELDDLDNHNTNKPIKGDIYFDGIEMESFLVAHDARLLEKVREEFDKKFGVTYLEKDEYGDMEPTDESDSFGCDSCDSNLKLRAEIRDLLSKLK